MMGTSVREEKSIPQRAQRRREEKIETKKKEKKRGEPPTPRVRRVGTQSAEGHPTLHKPKGGAPPLVIQRCLPSPGSRVGHPPEE